VTRPPAQPAKQTKPSHRARTPSERAQPDRLRLIRSSHDQLTVTWPAVADVSRWHVICWDRGDKPVARLKLAGKHHRATFAGLGAFDSPFTIAVSGFDNQDRVSWQAGLAELALRTPPRDTDASSPNRTGKH